MQVSENGLNLIKKFEGLSLKAYRCQAGIETIGYGATFYPNGAKVQMGEAISLEVANQLLAYHVGLFAKGVEKVIKAPINQNQFDALVSFAYNVGLQALQGSTLLKMINVNPNTPNIREQLLRWNKAKGKVLPGLTKRRSMEADLYFSI